MDQTNESDEATHSYRDRLRQLLTTTSSERRSIWSLPGSSTGSVKDDPNQDDSQSSEEEDASMDGYSNAGEPQDMGTTAPKQLVDLGMVMTCVAEYVPGPAFTRLIWWHMLTTPSLDERAK